MVFLQQIFILWVRSKFNPNNLDFPFKEETNCCCITYPQLDYNAIAIKFEIKVLRKLDLKLYRIFKDVFLDMIFSFVYFCFVIMIL